jgi:hypothetical protein
MHIRQMHVAKCIHVQIIKHRPYAELMHPAVYSKPNTPNLGYTSTTGAHAYNQTKSKPNKINNNSPTKQAHVDWMELG